MSYGVLAIKRALGHWSRPDFRRTSDFLNLLAVEPVLCMRRATGKNASEPALSVDAIELLDIGQDHGVCIVSSDSAQRGRLAYCWFLDDCNCPESDIDCEYDYLQ